MRLSRLDNFSVSHKFERRRYSPTKSQAKYLAALVECSRFAIWAYLNATRDGTRYGRPVSCRAYQAMPEGWRRSGGGGGGLCSERTGLVGGLEMNAKELAKSTEAVAGWCQLKANHSAHAGAHQHARRGANV
eukprot:2403331-Prymnesium_polylepis.2